MLFLFCRYYTVPPEVLSSEISTEIVSQLGEEFDIEKFEKEEKMMLDNVADEVAASTRVSVAPLVIDSTGPVEAFAVPSNPKVRDLNNYHIIFFEC